MRLDSGDGINFVVGRQTSDGDGSILRSLAGQWGGSWAAVDPRLIASGPNVPYYLRILAAVGLPNPDDRTKRLRLHSPVTRAASEISTP